MNAIRPDIDRWLAQGEAVALATVVQTWGSAPRQAGAKMAFTAGGDISGSVSGGCVEGAVIEAGQAVLATGQPQLLHFGISDETAWEVGLACGGTIDVFVGPLATAVYEFHGELDRKNLGGIAITIIHGPGLGQTMVMADDGRFVGEQSPYFNEAVIKIAQSATKSQRVQVSSETEIFVELIRPAPILIMIGGVHIAIALTKMAQTLGFRTIVIDPRRAFSSQTRFPQVDRLIQAWPKKAFAGIALTRETAVALLTHDPKIDDQALALLLPSPVFYIGALGSRQTHAKRTERLRQLGYNEAEISRIHAPIGLDIGARSPEEIALSIMAEIINVMHAA